MNRSNDDKRTQTTDTSEHVLVASDVQPLRYGTEGAAPDERSHWARDPLFWTQRLRLGQYFQLMPGLLNQPDDRALLVHKWLSNGTRTRVACELLGLPTTGTIAERQHRLVDCPDTAYLLLACAFAVGKKDKAIEQAADLRLSTETRNRFGENDRIDDRHVAVMVLFDRDPTSLQTLRVLNEWHSLTAASADLNEVLPVPEQPLEAFLLSDDFMSLLHQEKARFDSLIPMGPGHWLLALTRNYRAQHIIGSDEQVLHGWGEETVVVHFRDGGRRVRISARSGLPSRLLASRIAAKYFGKPCHYAPDLAASTLESIYGMIDAALDPEDDALELTGITTKGALPGKSGCQLFGNAPVKETYDSLCVHYGDLLKRMQNVKHLKMRFEHRIFGLSILRLNGQWVVQFSDGRSDNMKAAAFRKHLLEHHNVEVRSSATSGRWAA
jgi:hypothetical protein